MQKTKSSDFPRNNRNPLFPEETEESIEMLRLSYPNLEHV